jgi:dienelactone hydrolase
MHGEEDCGNYLRRKVSFAVQPARSGEPLCVWRMPGYLLIPKAPQGRVPAIICMYGTTAGAGKDTTVGLSGRERGSQPHPNYSFALDMVKAGFVAFAPDWLRDGERVRPGEQPYESASFQREFPNWSILGKEVWDTSRAIDYLQTLDFVDPNRIGMVGHSYGAGGTIHAAALDERIKVAVANGPVSDPKEYHELTSLMAPRPLLVSQAVGERRPEEEEIYAAVSKVYQALGYPERVYYVWYPGDHDFPAAARRMAVDWLRRWFETRDDAKREDP